MRGGGHEKTSKVAHNKNKTGEEKIAEASNMIEFQRIGSFRRKSVLPQVRESYVEIFITKPHLFLV